MKNIKLGDMKTRDFFRFSFKKILIDLIVSGLLVFLMFFKAPLYRDIFLRESLGRQIVDIGVNFLVYVLIFYIPSCYFTLKFFRGERKI
jgi:hypothetical protein